MATLLKILKIQIILLILVQTIACEPNQLKIVDTWDNGARKEAWEVSPNGEVVKWFSWYRNHIQAEEMEFSNGVPNGLYRKWSITGFVMEKGNYKDSLRDGKWTWFAKERIPSSQGFYKKGLKHGRWTFFDLDGKLSAEQFFEDDKPIGNWKKYKDEKLIEENSCFEANEIGFLKVYNSEGKISLYRECRKGRLGGVSKEYYPGGSLHKIGLFENGLRHGVWLEYFANGKLRKIENWTHYLRNGEWVKFNDAGLILDKAEFIDGTGTFEDTSWRDNRIDGDIRIKLQNDEYLRIEHWNYGEKQSTTDYHKDSPKPVAQGHFQNKQKHGAWRTWYKSGILKDSLNFRYGEQFGEQFHYDSTGRLYKREIVQENGGKIVEMVR